MGKKRRKEKRKLRRERLKQFGKDLNNDLPASERWFHSIWKKRPGEVRNTPLGYYIPDVMNRKWKYIIEIDGSIHDTEYQRLKDARKDKFYKTSGYTVFRIKHGDSQAIQELSAKIAQIFCVYPDGVKGRDQAKSSAEVRREVEARATVRRIPIEQYLAEKRKKGESV